jgi:hypothetical protein
VGAENLSSGLNRSRDEATHLPPSSAEVLNAWNYTSILKERIEEGMELAVFTAIKLWAVVSCVMLPWSFSSEY